MKTYRVQFTRRADIHLAALHAFISERDGPWKADSAVRKLLKTCALLEAMPRRGFSRPDLGEGLRSWRISKRATIVFEILEVGRTVLVHGVFTGGRDIEAYFRRN